MRVLGTFSGTLGKHKSSTLVASVPYIRLTGDILYYLILMYESHMSHNIDSLTNF